MKLSTAFITGLFISISALVFFRQDEKLMHFLQGKQTPPPVTEKTDDNGNKKKKTTHIPVQGKTAGSTSAKKAAWQPFFVPAPPITAVKTVDKTENAVAGDVLNYSVTITNNNLVDAANLSFTDNVDPNTTIVTGSLKTSPVAFDDSYAAIGNVGISVPDANGVLTNDGLGTNPAAVFTAVTNAATTQGGTISITGGGGISYTPPAGFTGNDTYVYTLSNDAGSSSATITIAVSGMIWFINNNSVAATADGRLNTPFKTVTAFQSVNNGTGNNPSDNQNIFVFESATPYSGNITLRNGQQLIGQDASAALTAITGYTDFPYSIPLLPAMNNANSDLTHLTASGTDNVVALNGGSSANYTIRGVTIGNKISGSGISGAGFGTLNVSETSITGTGQALNLQTGSVNGTFPTVSSSSGAKAVSLTGIAGTITITSGTLSGSTDTLFKVNGGSVSITNSGSMTQAANFAMISIANSHSGTITFQTGTLSATNGNGLQFDKANGTYNFNGTTTLNGGDAGIDIVNTSTGVFSFAAATSVNNPTGTAVNIGSGTAGSGGSGNVTYSGTITKTNSGKAVEIQNKTAGIVNFTGSINGNGSSGINLSANTGATVNFTGGLALNTGTAVAFNATGGGTISATQNNTTVVNTLLTTTATALNVANTTIGASGLAFRSITVGTAAAGPLTGISLNNTGSGGLTVTGQGTTAGSGGTIQKVTNRGIELITAQNIDLNNMELVNANTGDAGLVGVCEELNNGGCFAAVYGSAVNTLKLTKVNITTTAEQGINLNNVTALTISNCTVQGNGDANEEGALKAFDLKGTCSITNSLFKNSASRIAHIRNSTGSVNLTVNNCSFINDATNTSTIKQDCFQMRVKSTATATVSLTNSTFKQAGTAAINFYAEDNSTANLTITGCTADREGTLMKGIDVGSDHTAHLNVNVDNNPLLTGKEEVSLNITSTGTASVTNATARNNTIKGGNDPNTSSFVQLNLWATQTATTNVLAAGNTVTELDGRAGIESFALHSQSIAGSSQMNATIQSNTVTGTSTLTGNGIRVTTSVTGATGTSANCSFVGSNNVTMAGSLPNFRVTNGSATSTIRLTGTGTSAATIWNGNSNTPASPPAVVIDNAINPANTTYGGTPCTQPSGTPLLPIAAPRESGISTLTVASQMGKTREEPFLKEPAEVKLPAPVTAAETTPIVQSLPITNLPEALSVMETVTPTSITVSDITLPPSKSITIKFQAAINDPLPSSVCSISNQGSVSGGDLVTPVLTDNDNDLGNGIHPTVTTIKDETAPELTCPDPVTVTETTPGAGTSVNFEATATDNCTGSLTPQYFIGSTEIFSPHTFPVGTTTVDVTVSDAANNPANCSFTVTVNPACEIHCPDNVIVDAAVGECGATVSYDEATTTGECGELTYSKESGTFFNIGTTTVTVSSASTGQTCTFTVTVNDPAPTVTSVEVPADGYYKSGAFLDFTVHFSTAVTVTGSPQLALTIGSTTRHANYVSGSGSDALTFRYTVANTDLDADGITVGTLSTNGGTIQNSCLTNANLALNDVGTTAGVLVDGIAPTVTINQAAGQADPTTGSTINFTVQFSEAVTGFTDEDVLLSGTAGATTAAVSGNGDTYTVQVSGMTSVGTVIAEIGAGVAEDIAGNANTASTSTDNSVTVECSVICPDNITVETGPAETRCGANVPFTVSSTCGATVLSTANGNPVSSGDFFPVGTTTVTSTASGTQCSFTITVNDKTPPTVTCPVPTSAPANSSCEGIVPNVVATVNVNDNCSTPDQITLTQNPAAGTSVPVGPTTITVTATDGAGNQSTCTTTFTVTDQTGPTFSVQPVAEPQVLWPPDHKMKDVFLNNYAATDNCGNTVTYRITISSNESTHGTGDGDRSPDWIVIDSTSPHPTHLQLRAERGNGRDARIYTITVTATDGSGNETISQSTQVRIAHNITAPQSGTPFKIGSTVNFAGVFWDKPGTKHTAQWLIDGTALKGTVTEPSGTKNGKVSGSYKFNTAGVYKLQMNVTDQNRVTSYCNTNEDLEAIVVIYDPNGGYTYGGGQFVSPKGALKADPNATGLISYGFTVTYYKGATYPKGETQLELKVGDFEYNALNFDYLSINGAKAQFKGSGRIIGAQSGINFIATVTDGQLDGTGVDKIRVKIYNKNTGEIYYDNEPGTGDADNPVTRVGPNSSVTISTSKIKTREIPETIITEPVQELYATAIPNPSTNSFSLRVNGGNAGETITMQVFDAYGRLIDVRKTTAASSLVIGDRYRPGTYYVRFSQGKLHKEIKLIKLPD